MKLNELDVIREYSQPGAGIKTVARKFKVRRHQIEYLLVKNNVKIKTASELKSELVGENSNRYGMPPPIGAGRCRWYRYHNKTYQGSWEFMFGLWLEQQNIKFNVHENVKQFHCKHENEMEFTYCPDFYLVDYDRYVEVKGYFSDENKKRMQLFRQQHSNIDVTIIDKNKLVEIGAFEVQKKLNIDLELYQLDYENEKSVKKFIDNTNKIEFLKFYILDGLNLSELAQKYDVPYRVISHAYNLWVPEHGSNEFYQFILQQCKDSIIKDCELGLGYRQIVRKYKFRSNTKILLDAISNWGSTIQEAQRQNSKLSKQIDDSIRQSVLSDYELGLSKRKICRKYHLSKKYINQIFYEANVQNRPTSYYTLLKHEINRKQQFDGNEKLIIDDYNKGLGIRVICRKYNVSRSSIKRLLLQNSCKIRQSAYYSTDKARQIDKETASLIIQEYEQGLSIRDIVKKHNVTRKAIRMLMASKGIEIKKAEYYAAILSKQKALDRQSTNTQSIINDYNCGQGLKLVAKKYHTTGNIVKNIILSNGGQLKSKAELFNVKSQIRFQNKVNDVSNKDDIIRDYKSGLSIGNICAKYCIKRRIIKKILIDSAIEIRPSENYASIVNKQKNSQNRQRLLEGKIESIIVDYKLGVNIRQLQCRYNVSAYIIKTALAERNVKRTV
jgi:hypothetical protein